LEQEVMQQRSALVIACGGHDEALLERGESNGPWRSMDLHLEGEWTFLYVLGHFVYFLSLLIPELTMRTLFHSVTFPFE